MCTNYGIHALLHNDDPFVECDFPITNIIEIRDETLTTVILSVGFRVNEYTVYY